MRRFFRQIAFQLSPSQAQVKARRWWVKYGRPWWYRHIQPGKGFNIPEARS